MPYGPYGMAGARSLTSAPVVGKTLAGAWYLGSQWCSEGKGSLTEWARLNHYTADTNEKQGMHGPSAGPTMSRKKDRF